jgi:heptosyltransferase III
LKRACLRPHVWGPALSREVRSRRRATTSNMINRLLIVRTDRLGDVLLTTPLSRRVREQFPKAHITWLVRPYTAPLLENNPDVNHVLVDHDGPVSALIERLKQEKFDAAIVAYPRWRTTWAVWRAGIPLRVGPANKWYSLFFNPHVWQHRSEGKKHEADYNLELLEPLGIPFKRTATRLELSTDEKNEAKKFLSSMRISFRKPVVCLHPGSGGSSERWPLTHFMELGDRLQEAGCDVIVTGGPGEDYQNVMIDNMHRIPVFVAAGSVSVRQFASILSCSNLVVSNSTGPLHIAVALGVPTVSVYSPIPTCHPRRWGPYPAYPDGDERHSVLMPSDGDMASVRVEQAFKECQKKLGSLLGVSVA